MPPLLFLLVSAGLYDGYLLIVIMRLRTYVKKATLNYVEGKKIKGTTSPSKYSLVLYIFWGLLLVVLSLVHFLLVNIIISI